MQVETVNKFETVPLKPGESALGHPAKGGERTGVDIIYITLYFSQYLIIKNETRTNDQHKHL